MSRKITYLLVLVLVFCLSTAAPTTVQAEGDPPPETKPIQPPWITGINPQVSISAEETGEIDPTGIAQPLAENPQYVELSPQLAGEVSASASLLAVPQRYQDPEDVTCGAAALGMAMEFMSLGGEGKAPSEGTLIHDLKKAGLLYKSGTGVEELAYLARGYGYRGTTAFHNGSLVELKEELAAGNPVVVSLGLNGAGQPGHFVTLTGISADGEWVSYNDPILGAKKVSAAEFLASWELQGKSGLLVSNESLSAADDPLLPWMGLVAALAVLAVLGKHYPVKSEVAKAIKVIQGILSHPRRKGFGGAVIAGAGVGGVKSSSPPYNAPPGYHWEKKSVPQYGWKDVPVTKTRQVPILVPKQVQVGTEVWYEKVPRYRTVRVDEGYWARRRVTKYRRERYVRYYRTRRERRTRWVRRGWRFYRQTYYVTKRTPVYGYRRKPYTDWERYWKSKWVTRQEFDGYRYERREKPVYETRMVPSGRYRTEYYTDMVSRYVQVGTTVKWELKKNKAQSSTSDILTYKETILMGDSEGNTIASKPILTPPPPEDPEQPNNDGDDPDSLLYKIWDAGIDLAAKAASYLSENPFKIGPIDIPVVIPRGFGLEDESSVVIYRALEKVEPWKLRAIGRGMDEFLSFATWPIGWGLTVAPEQIENANKNAPSYEIEADLEIDTMGFVLSELAGDAAFLLSLGTGPGSIFIGAGVDVGVGFLYDTAVDEFGIRDLKIAQEKWIEENTPDPVERPTAPDNSSETTATPSSEEEKPTETPEPPQATPEPSPNPHPN